MKPLSQTQEKFPPGWLTQRPCGPHTPEAVAPAARGPASNPQLSITLQAPPRHGSRGTEQFLPPMWSGQAQ